MKFNIREITINDKEYPFLLKQIRYYPKKLYVIGDINILNKKCLSIIGCRDCSEYGKKVAEKIARKKASEGITIVSGLARGIDYYAHLGAIEEKGKTIAIVANGLDIIYPKENINLRNKILENGGAILSEYELGTPPLKQNFPARNRLISGISMSTIVVEAKIHSGSLITANFAVEQNRNVFAVPGSIFSKRSEGTNDIIHQGAEILDFNNLKNVIVY